MTSALLAAGEELGMLKNAALILAAGQLILWPNCSFSQNIAEEQLVAQAQVNASEPVIAGGQNKVDANAGTVTVMTTRNLGSPAMTSTLDLSTLLDSGEQYQDMRVIPVVARGKVQNLWDILYLKGVDMGFVQTDVLAYLEDDPRINSIKNRIRFITVMFPAEVHIVARKDIGTLQDLAGKKVSINAKGTGSSVVGTLLFKRLGIDAILEHEDTNRAIARMKEGDLAAHINVLGKPARPVARIKKEDELHLLAIPFTPEVAEIYLPSSFTSEDYPNLVPAGTEVETIAAGNVLAAYNWPEDHPRYQKVARFVDAFFSRFEELKQPGFHPKWKDVNIGASVAGWTRFKAAQDWIDNHRQPVVTGSTGGSQLQREFTTFATVQGGLSSAQISESQKNALFEEFLKWRGSRQ
ncbi:MAG: TAXI family TRAP transporter solute-binding subunit [Gammaproteobacteria bacterium]